MSGSMEHESKTTCRSLSLVLSLEYFKLGHEGDVLRHMTWLCEVG